MNSYSRLILSCIVPLLLFGCATSEYIEYHKTSRQYNPDALSEDLKSKNKYIRQSAVLNAGSMGGDSHIDLLINMASVDSEPNIRGLALSALSNIFRRTKNHMALQALINASERNEKSALIRMYLLMSLSNVSYNTPEVIPIIINKYLVDEDTVPYFVSRNRNLRKDAIDDLVSIGEGAVKPLIAALKSENSKIRSGVMEALVKLGEKAVDPLIAELNTEDIRIKTDAIEVLGEIGNAKAIEPLTALLTDEREDIRKLAADAIGKINILSKVKM